MPDPKMKGFLVFRGVDRVFVVFGEIARDASGAAVIYQLEDGTLVPLTVPLQHVVGIVIGESAAHADAAIALCGDEQPTMLPTRSSEEITA